MNNKFTFVRVCNTFKKHTLIALFLIVISLESFAQLTPNQITYFEDFNSPGIPTNIPAGTYWDFYNEIYPSQDAWNEFIPGDGNAYITVDADITNDTDWIHPFQTLIFGGAAENQRLEVRMKGAVTDGGLVGFLFTYNQVGEIFNEVDIEVVANDSATPPHETLPENGGWTDARFNTWRNANENTERPFTGTKKPVINQLNEKISLIDDQFHVYTIDWREDRIDFFIDNVLQETITTSVATGMSEVIIGFRQLPWAGGFNWTGTHTMVIDYLKIEPLQVITFAGNDTFIVDTDSTVNLDVLANDTANSSIVYFDNISAQGFPVSGTSSLLSYTTTGGFLGTDSFTYTLEDSNGVQATGTVNITVQPGPLTAIDDFVTVAPGSINIPIDVTANDEYGPAGENSSHPLTFNNGSTSSASNNGGAIAVINGKINYSTPSNFTGIDSFGYTITDGNGYADSGIVTITVGGPVVTIPVAVNDSFSIDIDTATNLDVLSNDTLSGATISSFDATSAQGFSVSISSSLLTYTPTGGFFGTDSFTYTIEDVNGVQSTATVTLTVEEEVIQAGVLAALNDSATVAPGSSNTPIDVTANDNFGINGENTSHPLTLTNGKLATASNNGGFIEVVNGNVNYSAPTGFTGIDTFTYTITDGSGFAATGTVTVTVGGPVVTIPIAVNDSFSVDKDIATNLDVLANDTLSGATISSFDATSAQGYSVSISSSLLTYTPTGGFVGTDSFTYTIEDVNGVQSTATVTLTVEEEVVQAGVLAAVNDSATVAPGSSNTPIDVTANDNFGINGENTSHPLTLTNGKLATASNNGGFIEVVNGNVNYSAPTGFTGIDTFTYTITDGSGFAATGTVTVTVGGPVVTIPIAVNDSFTIDKDIATDLDVLANDTLSGAIISSFDATSAQGYAVTISASLLTYSPTGGFVGTDSFTYTIEDINGVQSTATVTLTVEEEVVQTGVLMAIDDSATVAPDSSNTPIDVTANDNFGINGENTSHPLTLTNGKTATASNNGGFIAVVNGNVNYSAPTGFTGIDTFTYTITDGNGFADTGMVTVTVGGSASKSTMKSSLPLNSDNSSIEGLENKFTVYPNPSKGYLKNTLFSSVNTKANLILFDVAGKVVYRSFVDIEKGSNEFELNVNLKPGIIFMKILSSEVNFGTKKIVLK